MKQEQASSWSVPQRQPISGLLVAIFKALRVILKAFWPLIILILFREQQKGLDTYEFLLLIIPLFIILKALADFFYLRFSIADGKLFIKKVFIQKKNITIPLNRIHAVDLEQHVLHRLLKIAAVKIDTAGSEKTEAVIDALEWEKAALLKNFLLSAERDETSEAAPERFASTEKNLIHLSPGDLLKMGLSANHIQAIFIVFAFAVSALQNLEEIFGPQVIEYVEQSRSTIAFTFNILTLIALAVLLLSVLVSLVKTFLQYGNFSVGETLKGFRLEWGLLNTRQNLVPFDKIQYLSWSANWIRRKINLYYLDLHQATRDSTPAKRRVKIPLPDPSTIEPILKHYHHDIREAYDSNHTMYAGYAWRRVLIHGIPVALVAFAIGYFWLENLASLALLYIPYDFISAVIYRKNFRIYATDSAVQRVSGVWGRQIALIRWYKIQQVEFRQSIFQRRRQLASLRLVTAGGTILLPYLSADLAWKIYNYALYQVESRGYRQHTTEEQQDAGSTPEIS